ncbi:MAG: hypothetical protein Kow0020_09620 [Wenzhouxiangellaceae bacterium]
MSRELPWLWRSQGWLRGLVLALAWLAVWQAGRLLEYTEHASVWFPAAGLTFAALLVSGWRAVLPIFVAAIVITLWSIAHYGLPLDRQDALVAGALFGVAHIVPYAAGAWLVSRVARRLSHTTPQLIVAFLLAAFVSSLGATLLVIGSLVLTDQMQVTDVRNTVLPFWIGDLAGVVSLAPLFSAILARLVPQPRVVLKEFVQLEKGSLYSFVGKYALSALILIASILVAHFSDVPESSYLIFFLAITHMWIASTESPFLNVLSLALTSTLIALLANMFGLMDHVMVYQFAICVVAANGLFGIIVPQLQAHNERLAKLVATDALTGVSSRHFLQQRANLEISGSRNSGQPLSLAVIDLDRFKQVNDRHGHASGDRALIALCEFARLNTRRQDIISRFGGDEFVLLMPGQALSDAVQAAERIRIAISTFKLAGDTITCSIGVAELRDADDFAALFHRADLALYRAKQAGGNRVETGDD